MPGILADNDRMMRLLGAKPEVIQKIDRLLVGAETPVEHTGPLVMSITGAAKAAGLSRSSLYRGIACGQLKVVKILGRNRVRREDLAAFLNGNVRGAS